MLHLAEHNSGGIDLLYTQQVIKPILVAMRYHPACLELQSTACSLIMSLSADGESSLCWVFSSVRNSLGS